MITILKQYIQDYENSGHVEYTISTDYKFEEEILEQYLSQAVGEGKEFLRKLTKGEKNG